jgi:hypothetical protein
LLKINIQLFARHHGNLFEIVADHFEKIGGAAFEVPLLVKADGKSQNTFITKGWDERGVPPN